MDTVRRYRDIQSDLAMISPCEDGALETKGENFVPKCDLKLRKGDCNSASFIEESRGQEGETLQEVQWSMLCNAINLGKCFF